MPLDLERCWIPFGGPFRLAKATSFLELWGVGGTMAFEIPDTSGCACRFGGPLIAASLFVPANELSIDRKIVRGIVNAAEHRMGQSVGEGTGCLKKVSVSCSGGVPPKTLEV